MMVTVLVLALLGSLPLNFLRDLLGSRARKPLGLRLFQLFAGFGVSCLVAWIAVYFGLPSFTGPFWGVGTSFTLILLWVVNALVQVVVTFVHHSFTRTGRYDEPDIELPLVLCLVPLLLVLMLGRWAAGWEMFHSEALKGMIEVEVKKPQHMEGVQTIGLESPVSEVEIRMVPLESAIYLGDAALGSDEAPKGLGSQFRPGEYTLQKIGNHMKYVAPLEYQHWGAWRSAKGSPGFIKISATDPDAAAELVLHKKDGSPYEMKYMPSAYFGYALERHLWSNGYNSCWLVDFSFELDDDDRPYWVVTTVRPTIQYGAPTVTGILVIDPETGEIREYSKEDAPVWIDRIYPDDVVMKYLTWYGSYQGGYWNTTWIGSGAGVEMPVHLPHLVYGDDGTSYFYACMSSQQLSDNAMTAIVLVNSRTGKASEYRVGGKTDEAVQESVQSELRNLPGWKACLAVPYTIYGQLTWAVPVVNERGQFKRLALVRHETMRIAFGDNKRDALNNYRKLLVDGGNGDAPAVHSDTKSVTFEVGHIGRLSGDQIGIRPKNAPWKEYVGSEQVNRELPYTLPGHTVTITYVETGENVVQIVTFDNQAIPNQPAAPKP